jgi:hypothetical protein
MSYGIEDVKMRDGHLIRHYTYSEANPDEVTTYIFHIHGGAFSSGTHLYGEEMCKLMSKTVKESVVCGLNFRMTDVDTCWNDIIDSITYIRQRGAKVYLTGGSSGG